MLACKSKSYKINSDNIAVNFDFQVRAVKHGKPMGRVTLKVDVQTGRLFAVKPSKDILDASNTFSHEKSNLLLSLFTNTSLFKLQINIVKNVSKY